MSVAENALMLVGVLPNPKDLEIARLLGWYRIPLRMAPKIVDVDYVAFYQTSAFGAEKHRRVLPDPRPEPDVGRAGPGAPGGPRAGGAGGPVPGVQRDQPRLPAGAR